MLPPWSIRSERSISPNLLSQRTAQPQETKKPKNSDLMVNFHVRKFLYGADAQGNRTK